MIHITRSRPTQQQMSDMLHTLGTYIKLAVDIQRGILAGGGAEILDPVIQEGVAQVAQKLLGDV